MGGRAREQRETPEPPGIDLESCRGNENESVVCVEDVLVPNLSWRLAALSLTPSRALLVSVCSLGRPQRPHGLVPSGGLPYRSESSSMASAHLPRDGSLTSLQALN